MDFSRAACCRPDEFLEAGVGVCDEVNGVGDGVAVVVRGDGVCPFSKQERDQVGAFRVAQDCAG